MVDRAPRHGRSEWSPKMVEIVFDKIKNRSCVHVCAQVGPLILRPVDDSNGLSFPTSSTVIKETAFGRQKKSTIENQARKKKKEQLCTFKRRRSCEEEKRGEDREKQRRGKEREWERGGVEGGRGAAENPREGEKQRSE